MNPLDCSIVISQIITELYNSESPEFYVVRTLNKTWYHAFTTFKLTRLSHEDVKLLAYMYAIKNRADLRLYPRPSTLDLMTVVSDYAAAHNVMELCIGPNALEHAIRFYRNETTEQSGYNVI